MAYRQLLESRNAELQFDGKPVWDVIASAIDAASADLSHTRDAPGSSIIAHRITVAIYHPLEQAIYLAVETCSTCTEWFIDRVRFEFPCSLFIAIVRGDSAETCERESARDLF